jgi:two-component SAPR family response regulator
MDGTTSLDGRRILVVEDESLVAMELEDVLDRERCRVIGPAQSVADALRLIEREPPDAALVDLDLGGQQSTPVAAALKDRHVPFVLVTGHDVRRMNEPELQDVPWLSKPVDRSELTRTLAQVLASAA